MTAWLPLLLALAACSSGDSDEQPAQSATEPASVAAPPAPPALFVLGDSLSDIGNAAAAADYVLNQPIEPPTVGLCNPTEVLALHRGCEDLFYQRSRVSDGPVAIEHLANRLGLAPLRASLHLLPDEPHDGTVYAIASAKARGIGEWDLHRQVDWLLLGHMPLPADAVYVVMIGGNDALDALQADAATPGPAVRPSAAIVTAAVDAIAADVTRLLDFGARHIVVANVPDLATLPAVRAKARASGDEAAALAGASAISAAFDRELDAKLDAIEVGVGRWPPPTPVITRFDLLAAMSAAHGTLAASGANVVDACFASDVYRDSAAAQRVFHPDCGPVTPDGPPRFSAFAFFDGIHPTGVAHAALGEALGALF
jgi:phospholipase/lecithinase/hemolysin